MTNERASEPIEIDVWSDIACPWCYIGKRNLDTALAQLADDAVFPEVNITFHSFELAPDTPVDYAGSELDFLCEYKGFPAEHVRRMLDNVKSVAANVGLDYDFDAVKHTNTGKAHELLHFAKANGAQRELAERLMSAYFVEGRHIGKVDDLADLAAEIGLDRAAARAALMSGEYGLAVKQDKDRAVALGVQGVPYFVIDSKYAVSGAQAAEGFVQALRRVADER